MIKRIFLLSVVLFSIFLLTPVISQGDDLTDDELRELYPMVVGAGPDLPITPPGWIAEEGVVNTAEFFSGSVSLPDQTNGEGLLGCGGDQ
jgi:hypothetical protein